jgi:hypothetical protein
MLGITPSVFVIKQCIVFKTHRHIRTHGFKKSYVT